MTSQNSAARLFLALWPSDAVRAQLGRFRDAWRWPPGSRPVPDPKLHLTLHFIGDFPRRRIAVLGDALAKVRIEPTTLHPQTAEVFGRGIAVLRLRREPRVLALHEDLAAVLSGLGVALEERPFAAHVTMARRAAGAEPPAELPDLAWPVAAFALVESVRRAGGAYEVLGMWGE